MTTATLVPATRRRPNVLVVACVWSGRTRAVCDGRAMVAYVVVIAAAFVVVVAFGVTKCLWVLAFGLVPKAGSARRARGEV